MITVYFLFLSTSKQASNIDNEYNTGNKGVWPYNSTSDSSDALPVDVEEEMSLITAAAKKRDHKYMLKPGEEFPDSDPTDVLQDIKRKREEERNEDK